MIRVKFKCPKCQKDISIKAESKAALMNVSFTCPQCGQTTPFSNIFGNNNMPPQFKQALHTHIAGAGAFSPVAGFQKTRVANAGLLVIVVENIQKRIPIGVGSHILGRESNDSSATVKVAPDPYMSRQHARLELSKKGNAVICRIQPLKSNNPVIINGEQLEEGQVKALKLSDKIILGMTTIHLEVNK